MNNPNNQATGNEWTDFNNAQVQQDYDLIPKGTLAKVRLTLNPGGYDEPHMGWTGGWATKGDSGAVFLKAEYVVLTGPFAKRKVWSLIGLHSPKGPNWSNMGRSFVRSLLCSARGIQQEDNSPQAVMARRLQNFGELDGMEFVARIDVEKDADDEPTNVIKHVITPDHKQYQMLMSEVVASQRQAPVQTQAPQQSNQQQPYPQQGANGYQQNPDYQFQQPAPQQGPNNNWQD
ncbi:hypothetical protein [Parendozoicomonas sp. Alg238-R29]|uniref:hypothetical protein n=1 Tax=Parendozoicomonas sp. Alg238-R29 TaxID=2993446 RepID=UPI00248D982E|nr:hypothetical protein [Parendozoicomonas sp. Alg238-R29]